MDGLRALLRAALLVWVLGCCASVQAQVVQRPVFRLTGVAQGLPSATVSALALDRQGYLWLATYDGLARYDGTEFDVWQHDPRDSASISSNLTQALYIDDQDRIWVAGAGVSVLDAERKRFVRYDTDHQRQMRSDDVYAIGGQGADVWFGTNGGGLYRVTPDGALTRFDKENTGGALPSDEVISLASDARGRLWVGTIDGMAYIQDGKVMKPAADEQPAHPAPLLMRVGDTLWASGAWGPAMLGPTGPWRVPRWASMFEEENQIVSVADAGRGEYWLGTSQGLWLTHGQRAPQPVRDRDALFANRYVPAFQQVPGAGTWVSVMGKGLAYVPASWRRLAVIPPVKGTAISPYCSVAPGADGMLWRIDGDGALEQFDTRSGDVSLSAMRDRQLKGMAPSTGLEDRRGQVWLGHRPSHLARFDPVTGEHKRWRIERYPGYGMAPEALMEDPRGDVWVGVAGMVQRRDGSSGEVLDEIRNHPSTDEDLAFAQLSPGADGEPWVASATGILRWDPERRALVPLQGITGEEDVSGFVPESADAVWLFREGQLERWVQRGKRWTLDRTIGEGLPSVPANGMQRDDQGRLWVATQRGLLRVDPASGHIRTFGVRDGLPSQEFLDFCLYRLDTGVLASTTSDGALVLIDPKLPDRPPMTPPLLVQPPTVVRGGAVVVLPDASPRLLPGDRELRVSARLLAFDDPGGNRYRSRLVGLDPDWVSQGASGDRVLSALAPGAYTLELQGFDTGGNASRVHRLHFTVDPPWWRSATGIALLTAAVALGLALCAWLYRERVRRRTAWNLAQHKRQLAEQASQAKSHFLATLGHEVRTPMTGVLGMSELLLGTALDPRQRGYTTAIQKAGTHLLRLVNDALDLARIEAGKLELDQQDFDLRELLDGVAALSAPLATQRGLDFACKVDPAVPTWLRGDPGRVRQILLNLLGNAIKFTEHGQVALHAAPLVGGGVVLSIQDTGPGMSAEQQARLFQRFEQAEGARTAARYGGSGLGLAICQELAVAMGGRIQVQSTPGQGTRFLVELPLPAAAAPRALLRPLAPEATGALSVLLVEDDATIAEVITGLLQARGHQVRAVPHGLAALTEAALARFDIALLDLDLPGMDGLALARQFRAQGMPLPLLAVTARADGQAEALARQAGFDGFLRKPVTGELLGEAMAAALEAAAQRAAASG